MNASNDKTITRLSQAPASRALNYERSRPGQQRERFPYVVTFIWICLGLFVIGILLPALPEIRWPGAGRRNRAMLDLQSIEVAIFAFRSDTGRTPTDAEGVEGLLTDSGHLAGWRGPYAMARIRTDPWKHPYVYHVDADGAGYTLRSRGPDGKLGTADDIVTHVSLGFLSAR